MLHESFCILAGLGLNIRTMEQILYIKLLDDGTVVYRPVPAIKLAQNIFRIGGESIYDPEDEIWEFKPGAYVVAEEQEVGGEFVFVAVNEATGYEKKSI